jgi:hypothetical protein
LRTLHQACHSHPARNAAAASLQARAGIIPTPTTHFFRGKITHPSHLLQCCERDWHPHDKRQQLATQVISYHSRRRHVAQLNPPAVYPRVSN